MEAAWRPGLMARTVRVLRSRTQVGAWSSGIFSIEGAQIGMRLSYL